MHWVNDYIGKQWSEQYDCFAHFMEVQKNHFGVDTFGEFINFPETLSYGGVLDYAKNETSVQQLWATVFNYQDGDAIIFGQGRLKFHIGTYLDVDGGGILHCAKSAGVAFTSMKKIKSRRTDIEVILRYRGSYDKVC